ncbi:uncharacterized protein TRAVEDRAFT_49487 [Trametes versicolor FP-101664 SS1]|uniref:uncharacterized protein n=1 Tax=Trametes versicolor (strain FP-101664) TaxID=717944 RepID=UPI000462228F|nr:uncharacterized protein TRAVEDRAFT_49487 [Trametes versicolor FP-101664 SS1]EIW56669.1 hypothetical protein TRAVEDRAFT_49487 [Trametes versicolor FP-101664 SS1]
MSTVIPGEVIIESNYTNRILSSVAFALLYYDFVLTIPQEVERYWERKFSLPSFLFFLNRYMSVLCHIPVIVEFFGVIPESRYQMLTTSVVQQCREFQQYHRFISMVIQGVVAALMLLRTYALYGQDRRVLILLSTIIGTGGIISVWVLVAGHRTRRPTVTYAEAIAKTGCDLTLSQEEGYDLAIAWSSILVFDAVVFILTLLQALKAGRSLSGSYLRVMLRDGTIYFAALFVCYLSNILAYALAKPVHKGVSTSITNVVSTTLITRLMLNIRDPKLRWGIDSTDSDYSYASSGEVYIARGH